MHTFGYIECLLLMISRWYNKRNDDEMLKGFAFEITNALTHRTQNNYINKYIT